MYTKIFFLFIYKLASPTYSTHKKRKNGHYISTSHPLFSSLVFSLALL